MKKILTSIMVSLTAGSLHGAGTNLLSVDVLDLPAAARIALADNPSIEAAHARIEQAKGRLRQARAPYWPGIFGDASYFRRDIAENLVSPAAALTDPADVYSASLQVQWLVFDGFARRFNSMAARYAHRGSKEAMQDTRRQLLGAVANAYYSAQLARENIAIAQADEEFNQRQLEDAKARHDAGTGSLSDALNFEVRANAARSSLIRSRRRYDISLAGLAALLGLPRSEFPSELQLASLEPEEEEELSSPDSDALVTSALVNRPDLRALLNEQERAEARSKAVRGEYYPVVSLGGSINGEREGDPDFSGDDFGNNVGGILTYTFSDGGERRGRLQEAKAAAAEAESNVRSLSIDVSAEVRESVFDVNASQEELALQRENADLVRRNRELVEKEYSSGQGSLVRLNEAQRDLVEAKSQLALALVVLRTAHVNLQVATGEILEMVAPVEETE